MLLHLLPRTSVARAARASRGAFGVCENDAAAWQGQNVASLPQKTIPLIDGSSHRPGTRTPPACSHVWEMDPTPEQEAEPESEQGLPVGVAEVGSCRLSSPATVGL